MQIQTGRQIGRGYTKMERQTGNEGYADIDR